MKRTIVKYPIFIAVKAGGRFTEEERQTLREKAWAKSLDNMTETHTAIDNFGNELLLGFDAYAIEQLSILKRLRHTFRVIKTAITSNIGIQPRVVIITLK